RDPSREIGAGKRRKVFDDEVCSASLSFFSVSLRFAFLLFFLFSNLLDVCPFSTSGMTDVPLTELDTQSTAAGSTEGGKYVYCIIRSDRQHDFGSIGIGGGQ